MSAVLVVTVKSIAETLDEIRAARQAARALPQPGLLSFWEAARRGELVLPYCESCAGFFFYPRSICPTCGSREVTWRQSSGRGRVHTFCIQHICPVPGFRDAVPFVTAIVELEEGLRLMTVLVDVEPNPDSVHCEIAVEVTFLEVGGHALPVFRPAA